MSSDLEGALILQPVTLPPAVQRESRGLNPADSFHGPGCLWQGQRRCCDKEILLNLSAAIFPIMFWRLAMQIPENRIPKCMFVARFPVIYLLSGISTKTFYEFRKMCKLLVSLIFTRRTPSHN